jgi:beta-lactamase regulating signal transducer with metallopeptidase domain
MLFSVVLIPVCFITISSDFFHIKVHTRSSSDALRIFDAILPRYNGFGIQRGSATGVVSVTKTTQSLGLISPWAVIIVVLWITGIIFSLTRVIVGKIGIMKIRTDACFIENRSIIETSDLFTKRLGIQRNIQVLTSFSCKVPFTYGTFKPVILLPSGATAWPGERLRSVLIHELAHVKRIDSFTLFFARIVCSLCWFIPVVWITYRHLHIEQEKSCDEYAVFEGIEAARYVRHILNVVRFARQRVLLTGIFFLRGKRKMIEKRILHLLKPEALKILTKKGVFITTVMLCFCLLAPILVFNPMFAEDEKDNISKKDFWNALSGIWLNTEYLGTWEFYEQKLIVYPDGKFEYYPFTTDTDPSRKAYFTLTEAWIDSEGVMWHKGIYKGPQTFYVLGKINKSGNTWEVIVDGVNNPTEWDTSKTLYEEYEIRYRQ